MSYIYYGSPLVGSRTTTSIGPRHRHFSYMKELTTWIKEFLFAESRARRSKKANKLKG